jgi:glycosyltransferase involved in cell wall biosynthesis
LRINPKITIVTPVYNCAKYIEETIQSVLNQTYKNIEYIIIDGGSDDGTYKIIKKYSKKITLLISEKDEGMYDALHKGFDKATGKYLSWINSDDLYFKDAIERSIDIMERNNLEWIVGAPRSLNKKNLLKSSILYHYPNFIIKNGLMTPCLWGYIPQESTIFTRKLYIKSGEINKKLKYAGDYDLWKKFANYSRLTSVNIPIGIFRKRENQISQNQKLYLKEVKKMYCIIPIGKFIRFLYSIFINKINEYFKKKI